MENCSAQTKLPASQLSLPSTPEDKTQWSSNSISLPPLVISARQTSQPILNEQKTNILESHTKCKLISRAQHVHNERGRSHDLPCEGCPRSRSLSLTDRSHARKIARKTRNDFISERMELFKSGINSEKEKKRRAHERYSHNNDNRKNKLKELRLITKPSLSKNPVNKNTDAVNIKSGINEHTKKLSRDVEIEMNPIGLGQEETPISIKTIVIFLNQIKELTSVTHLLSDKICGLEEKVDFVNQTNLVNGKLLKLVNEKLDKSITDEASNSKWQKDQLKSEFRGGNWDKKEVKIVTHTTNEDREVEQSKLVEKMAIDELECTQSKTTVPSNIEYLHKSFQEQIGISMNKPQSRNIFNFDEMLIAKGFDRAVATFQGLFWEHSREDICWKNLKRTEFPMDGVVCWKANGVQVFRLTRPDTRSKPRAHRFAVNPPDDYEGECNPLKVGKFYSHIYQTKVQVGRELRTLHSKRMALELKKMCGNEYRPRKFDLHSSNDSSSGYLRTGHRANVIPAKSPNFQPLAQIQTVPPYMNIQNPSQVQPIINTQFGQQQLYHGTSQPQPLLPHNQNHSQHA